MTEASAAFRAIFACDRKELKEIASKAKDLATTRPLTEKQNVCRSNIKNKIAEINPSVEKSMESRKVQLQKAEEEHKECTAAKEAAQVELEAAQKKLVEEKEVLHKTQETYAVAERAKHNVTLTPVQRYSKFIQQRASFQADLKWRSWILTTLNEVDDEQLKKMDLSDVFSLTEEWESAQEDIDGRIHELSLEGEYLSDIGAADTKDLSALQEAWEGLKAAKETQDVRLNRERERRSDMEANITAFVKEQGKLLLWCRQQTAQLEGLKQPEHVQEFCASLQSNNGTMEANFSVLSDMSETLLPNETVALALTEVTKEWFNLQVYTYERLRQCLMDQHQRSGLEDDVRAWSAYAEPIKEYLEQVEGLLQQPTDDEAVAYISPLLESTKALHNECLPHQLIADHLADFSLRMQCLQENYNAFRPSVFARLSLLYQTLSVGANGWKGKGDYNDKINELADWVEVKGKSGVWEQLLGRVEQLGSLVDEDDTLPLGEEGSIRH